MNTFTWGIEFETNLLITYKGEDRDVVWKKDKTQISTEFWDARLGHYPHVDENYWLNGKPEPDVGGVFNIESQIGVFRGISSLKDFDKNIGFLDKKLKKALSKKRLTTDSDTFSLFGYTEYHEEEENVPPLFLDKFSTMPGVYRSRAPGAFSGYRNELLDTDIYGKPQLTCSIRLDYIYKLFDMIYNHSNNYEEIGTSMELVGKYMNLLQKYKLSTQELNQLHGFLLYLLHFFEIYKYYTKYRKEQGDGPIKYFKSMFVIKPRTNPSSLYKTLTLRQRSAIEKVIKELQDQPQDEYDTYLVSIISNIDKKKCVYTKNLKGVPNAMYNYDNEDLETYLGFQEFKRFIKMDIPCVDPYDPDDAIDSELPTLVYLGDDIFEVDNSSQVWEWKTDIRSITYEFRDMIDLMYMSLQFMGEEENPHFSHFLEHEMVSPSELKEMVNIIFNQFFRSF
jgi:hypothetical protein